MMRFTKTDVAKERAIPNSSLLKKAGATADFSDCYEIPIAETSMKAHEIYMRMTAATPTWVNTLMTIRNRAVSLIKLKNVGNMGQFRRGKNAADYTVGDRLDLFTIESLGDDEVVMGVDDSHLDVKISVLKLCENGIHKIAVTTIVDIHNRVGTTYMFFVTPFHKRIVKTMLARSRPILNPVQ